MAGQSFSVVTNIASVDAQRNLYFSELSLNKTLAKLSSGRRIVEAGDDAAGLAIANSLRADGTALNQAVRNANDGTSLIQIADGALSKITEMLTRCVTLAEQCASETMGSKERDTVNIEYQEIMEEINRVVSVVNFRGERMFSTSQPLTKTIYVGDTQIESYIEISIGGANGAGTTAMGLTSGTFPDMSFSNVRTSGNARWVLHQLSTAIASVSAWRGSLGAQQNRLQNSVAVIAVQARNLKAAESTIRDANMAKEVVSQTRYQILMQSGMSALAQANATSQMVLSLLQ